MHILFTLEHFKDEITTNIKIVILTTFITYGGLTNEQIVEHELCV
jgi:hypothetical protein